jgi:hypothetical protein
MVEPNKLNSDRTPRRPALVILNVVAKEPNAVLKALRAMLKIRSNPIPLANEIVKKCMPLNALASK